VQIEWTERALERIRHAIGVWTAKAEADYRPGTRSEADNVLEGLMKRRKLRMDGLKYLRSWLPPEAGAQ
jgi:hypothetical protein